MITTVSQISHSSCSKAFPMGCTETAVSASSLLGVEPGTVITASARLPIEACGKIVIVARAAPYFFAFCAMTFRLPVSPEPEAITRRSPS